MAYSLDLRERVVRSWQNGRAKLWIAREFGIGISTVKRYIKRHEQTGNAQVHAQRRMQPKIGVTERAALQAQVDAQRRSYQPLQRDGNRDGSTAVFSRKGIQRVISPWIAFPCHMPSIGPFYVDIFIFTSLG